MMDFRLDRELLREIRARGRSDASEQAQPQRAEVNTAYRRHGAYLSCMAG
jgi:hypothetical protein